MVLSSVIHLIQRDHLIKGRIGDFTGQPLSLLVGTNRVIQYRSCIQYDAQSLLVLIPHAEAMYATDAADQTSGNEAAFS